VFPAYFYITNTPKKPDLKKETKSNKIKKMKEKVDERMDLKKNHKIKGS